MEQTRFDHEQKGLVPLPSFAWIALTNRCNLKCAHCQRELLKEEGLLKPREMQWQIFKKLEAELFPHLERIQFGGNNFGEQLLASNWDSFFERISKFKIGISIVTNAMLLNSKRIKAIVNCGGEFNFSLEGVTKESYMKIRGCKFEKFLGIVKETCQEKIKRSEFGARLNLGFVIFRDNIRGITRLIRIAVKLGVDRIIVTHFVPWQESQRYKSLVYHKELANKMLEKAKKLAGELNLKVDLPRPFKMEKNQDKPILHGIMSLSPCYHPWRSVSINEKGDVMPCCATNAVLGNLESASFSEIWNGRKYRKLRKTVNSSRPLGFCRKCAFRGIKMRSTSPLPFCSNESILLAAIGPDKHTKSFPLVLCKFKNSLRKTTWGKKLIPYLMELYCRHAAFINWSL
jgi:radical SAM protein with 4Fe4S-binding SPASM domain